MKMRQFALTIAILFMLTSVFSYHTAYSAAPEIPMERRILSLPDRVQAQTISPLYAAEALYQMGLFQGTEYGFDLDRTPTRQEMIVMLVRLMGLEDEAKKYTWTHPFKDVDSWASSYIGIAYQRGIVKGVSGSSLGARQNATAAQYITLVLRALFYQESDGYFTWDRPWVFSDAIGLTQGQYNASSKFTRGDMVHISYCALGTYLEDDDWVLFQYLKLWGAIPMQLQFIAPDWQPGIAVYPEVVTAKRNVEFGIDITFDDPNSGFNFYYDPTQLSLRLGEWLGPNDRMLYVTPKTTGKHSLYVFYSSGGSRYALARTLITVNG